EKPGVVERTERGLVGPFVNVVKAPEADVRHKVSGVNVDAVHLVKMLSAISLSHEAIGVVEIPLTAGRAGVIARLRLRIQAELRQHPAAYVVVMEVAADAEMCEVHFA